MTPTLPGAGFRPAPHFFDRRTFLRFGAGTAALATLDALVPGYAWAAPDESLTRTPDVLDGSATSLDLTIGHTEIRIGGQRGRATTINGSLPGPILRFREGDEAVIRVTNTLDEDTSLHWHGILLPNPMDGVPRVTYPGIRSGETFEYRFPIRQYGTYWYHSHSGFQEQLGQYGALIIDPADPEPFTYDRDYVVVLSDWTFEDPHRIMSRLHKRPAYYNYQKRTVADFFRDAADRGLFSTVGDRLMWGGMRMSPTDISDVTGATYTYLMNGMGPDANWTALFRPGERVRLRFVNASAASYFDVRIPGLPMTVVQASGQHVQPVETDEFRIAVAETFDVIVEPRGERAFTVFAEAMDRSGFARGTLAPQEGMEAEIPARRPRATLTMEDMGMDHSGMEGMTPDTAKAAATGAAMTMSGHEAHAMPAAPPSGHEKADMAMGGAGRTPGSLPEPTMHGPDHHGAGNAAVAVVSKSRLDEPGLGLGEDGWRVLRYTDLCSLEERHHLAPPDREIELHLTGNMERFMWSIDGQTYSEAEPIRLMLGERIRLTLVNDTMMNHPMHLHGMWMELENGKGTSIPRVHTVNVKPAERLSLLVNADAPGAWAFHCHILYHMDSGMFRVVEVSEGPVSDRPEEVGR